MLQLEKMYQSGKDYWGGAGGGGCCFHEKAEKYERYNEIHVIVMICHTVSEYHV